MSREDGGTGNVVSGIAWQCIVRLGPQYCFAALHDATKNGPRVVNFWKPDLFMKVHVPLTKQ